MGDFAVCSSDCDPAEDLQLASGESAPLQVAGRAPSQATVNRLAEGVELGCRLKPEGTRSELAKGAVAVDDTLDAGLALSSGGQRHASANLCVGPIEGRARLMQELLRLRKLLRRMLGITLEQRGLSERMSKGSQDVRGANARGVGCERVRTCLDERGVAPLSRERRSQAKTLGIRQRECFGHRFHELVPVGSSRTLELIGEGQPHAALDDRAPAPQAQLPSERERLAEQRPGPLRRTAHRTDQPERAEGMGDRVATLADGCGKQLACQRLRPLPLATVVKDEGKAGKTDNLLDWLVRGG